MNRPLHTLLAIGLTLATLSPRLHADKMGIQEPAGYSSRIDGTMIDEIYDSAVDSAGNVYVVGRSTSAEIKIDVNRDDVNEPSGRPTLENQETLLNLTDLGAGFVIKYDRDGKVIWRRSFGKGLNDWASGVSVDDSGNVYICGSIGGTVSFGSISVTAIPRSNVNFDNTDTNGMGGNVFAAMIDENGVWQWVRQFEFAHFTSTRTSAANLNQEALLSVRAQIHSDRIPSNTARGVQDGFGRALVLDRDGSLYLKLRIRPFIFPGQTPTANTIHWIRSAGAGQVPIVSVTSAGQVTSYDSVFIAKLAATPPPLGASAGTLPSYDWRWISPINSDVVFDENTKAISVIRTSPTSASVTGLALDAGGSLYATGAWSGFISASGPPRAAFTSSDAYVARWRASNGSQLYLATFSADSSSAGASFGGDLAPDGQGNVFVTGSATNTSLLRLTSADGTTMTKALTGAAANRTSFFLGKINPSGEWLWAEAPVHSIGVVGYSLKANSLTRDSAGALYLGGALSANTSGQGTIINFPGAGNIDMYDTGAEAFVAKFTEENASTRGWKWVLQTDFNGGGNTGGVLDTADLLAGPGGAVYWSVFASSLTANPPTPTRFSRNRSPNTADRAFDSVAGTGSFLLPVLADLPKLSDKFSPAPTLLVGTEVPAPDGVFKDASGKVLQPDVTLPGANNANGSAHFFWDTFGGKLYAISPALADVKWKVSDNPLNNDRVVRRILTVWPTAAQGLITHVTGAGPDKDEPRVSLEPPTIDFTFQSILYQNSNAQITGAKQFSAAATGYSVLLYVVGKNKAIGTAAAKLQVVRSYRWDDPLVKEPDVSATIGKEISGAPYSHADPSGKNGYLVNAKARFDGHGPGAAHNRTTQIGPIIPVNEDEPTVDDDMVVIWSNLSPMGVAWPTKTVKYNCEWPEGISDGAIVIASGKGSEVVPLGSPPTAAGERLDPAKYQAMSIYHQPDKNLPGYNPNEEHALLGDSQTGTGYKAVFALRSDLNNLVRTTSKPYTLLRYQDATDGLKTKFRVFRVIAENHPVIPDYHPGLAAYRFSEFTGDAGTPVLPPYPLSILAGASGTNGDGTAYFKDRKNQVWARSAGALAMRYFYPIQQNFWYDTNGDGVQDATAEAPWLDRLPGGTIGTPITVNYTITWPPQVPELRVGDTLTSARNELPDIEKMSSVAIIYDEATPAPLATSGVRIIDYTEERKVSIDAKINGLNFTLGGLSLAVEATPSGRFRFTDLPFHLKSRLSFDPINKQLIFGGYKDASGLGVPLLLPNVMSDREKERLLAFDTPNEAGWNLAISNLHFISRNPALVDRNNDNQPDTGYFVGLRENDADILVHADVRGPKALTTGKVTAGGYLTLVENNDPGLGGAPVALHIIRVLPEPVPGQIHVILSDNVFDEKLTIRHSSDFGGDPDLWEFEWYIRPDSGQTGPPATVNPTGSGGWQLLASGQGVNDFTIEGSGLRTLEDSWVVCRYRRHGSSGPWTDWALDPSSTSIDRRATLVEGWIKRVLGRVGLYQARVQDFGSTPSQTYSSAVQQAGSRYEGAVALSSDPDNLNTVGLISLYETVLRRGLDFSINSTNPQTSPAVNNALLLAATRISDFYMLLGNEAYADAQDPTIGFTSADGEVGSMASSVFAFSNQVPSLIREELALLRGRDNSSAGTGAAPVYNRLFWNFTKGIEGEPIYAQNYSITDQNVDGLVDVRDARILFPQGHGDAWGHYLTALKSSYRLLRHPLYVWVPRSESTTVAGVAIEVDYLDETKFARAAAALARSGAEIVNLTYRDRYVADAAGQWQGYKDSDATRAWGVDEWGRRAGQGAYFGWLTANAILPAVQTRSLRDPDGPAPTGLEKIDRTTVTEIGEIAAAFTQIQIQMDRADQGLNPLGVTPGSIPFDIDPAFLAIGSTVQGKGHFEQIYERANAAMGGARRVFDHANGLTQRLRKTQISADNFAQDSFEQEIDFRNRLIEIFGYPHPGNIGSGKTYPTGYNGPDLYFYNYVPVNDISGNLVKPNTAFSGFFKPFDQAWKFPEGGPPTDASDLQQVTKHYFANDTIDPTVSATGVLTATFPVATAAKWSFAAPAEWGQRRAPGELQLAIGDMVRAEAELRRGLLAYNNHIAQIQDEIDLLKARFGLQADQITLLNTEKDTLVDMNKAIGVLQAVSVGTSKAADIIEKVSSAFAIAVPSTPISTGDPVKGGIKAVAATAYGILQAASGITEVAANSIDLAKEEVGLTTAISIQKNDYKYEIQEALKSIEALMREEVGLRLDLFNLQEALRASSAAYFVKLAEGARIIEDRIIYNQKVAGAVQLNRYQDMTFRIFRNDALQKYRASFDLAARYVYLAATAYDYETCQLGSSNAAGRRFLTDIVRQRALGQFIGDDPVAGVNGLSDPLGRLNQNFQVLKGRLGINNPQIETGRFSLRSELFRLRDSSDAAWRDQLQAMRVPDLWKVPEFRRFCRPFAPESAGAQPGLIIPFATDVTFGQNFFGLPLGGGDSSYDSSNFATKINAAGVWLENYNDQGMSNTPRVYLIPVGLDILRAPDDVNLGTREFDVVDQAIPVPFPVGASDLSNPQWIPSNDNLSSPMNEIRRFSRFRAYHDSGFTLTETTSDTRLVGRSVWNSKWMLIIPGGTLLNDPNEGLDTFILGKKLPGSVNRDGNGISDIKLFFVTYGYSGN